MPSIGNQYQKLLKKANSSNKLNKSDQYDLYFGECTCLIARRYMLVGPNKLKVLMHICFLVNLRAIQTPIGPNKVNT